MTRREYRAAIYSLWRRLEEGQERGLALRVDPVVMKSSVGRPFIYKSIRMKL